MLRSWYIAFFQVPGLADWLLGRNDFSLAVRVLTASGKEGTFSRPELEEYKKAWSASGGLTGMLNWYRAAVQHRPPLPADVRVHVPALILWGKQDAALSHKMAEESLMLCDNGRLIFYENATHWVQHDEPEAVNRELIAFLR
jgi:epoxide hydrolase 4